MKDKLIETFELREKDGVHIFEHYEDEFSNDWFYDNNASVTSEWFIINKLKWTSVKSA